MLSNKCSKPLVYDPWYSYNHLVNSKDGQMAGGQGGQNFSLQFLQHTVKSISIVWDKYSIREISLTFTNGKEKSAGSKYPQPEQMFTSEIELEHGEYLDEQILIGEGYTQFMQEIFEDYTDECKFIGITQLAFKTNLGRTFNAGNQYNVNNLLNIEVNERIFAGFMGSAGNQINRLSFILQKPIKNQYVSKIFWHNYDMLSFNNKDPNKNLLKNKQIQINEFNQECNQNNHPVETKLSQNVQLGEDAQLAFDIPYINEKDSLIGFVSMFPNVKETVTETIQQEQNGNSFSKSNSDNLLKTSDANLKLNILKYPQQSNFDIKDERLQNEIYDDSRMSLDSLISKESREDQMSDYEKLIFTKSYKYDQVAMINSCSCAKIQQRVINGLNGGLKFYIHYQMEFTDGTDFTSFQEGSQNAHSIVQPNHELIHYSLPDHNCFLNV